VMRIRELHLQASDLDALRPFYADVLQLWTKRDKDCLRVQAGQSTLIFRQGGTYRYHFAFNIPENLLDSAIAWMQERTPLVESEPGEVIVNHSGWNAHAIYFYDPAGNILEFIARHDLDDSSDKLALYSISEIGLAVDDVQATRAAITSATGIPSYKGDGGAEFCAMGDAEGLFIIVETGRIWFPDTGVPAEDVPVTVVVESSRAFDMKLPSTSYRICAASVCDK